MRESSKISRLNHYSLKYTADKVSPMINRIKEIWILIKIVKHFVQNLDHLTIFQINKIYPENARRCKHIYHDQDTSGHLRTKFLFFYHHSHISPFQVLSQMVCLKTKAMNFCTKLKRFLWIKINVKITENFYVQFQRERKFKFWLTSIYDNSVSI